MFNRMTRQDNRTVPEENRKIAKSLLHQIIEQTERVDYSNSLSGLWSEDYFKKHADSFLSNPDRFIDRLRTDSWIFSGEASTSYYADENVTPYPDDSIWRYLKLASVLPEKWQFELPPILGESGWLINNRVINLDTAHYQEGLALLNLFGVTEKIDRIERDRKNLSILEVGGGFGALAYHFLKNHRCTYLQVDLPSSLLFSGGYLSCALGTEIDICVFDGTAECIEKLENDLTHGQERSVLWLVPSFQSENLAKLSEGCLDLAINIQSFSEMSEETVRDYARVLEKLLGQEGYLFEQNGNHSQNGGCYTGSIFPDYFPSQICCDEFGVGNFVTYFSDHLSMTGAVEISAPTIWTKGDLSDIQDRKDDPEIIRKYARSFEPTSRFFSRMSKFMFDRSSETTAAIRAELNIGSGIGWTDAKDDIDNLGDFRFSKR